MKSIMQEKDERCYLCMMLEGDYSRKCLQEHHVIHGTAGRKLSEKYGLKVYLCLYHHTVGSSAVHNNANINHMLQSQAQRAFEKHYPKLDWFSIFKKYYAMDESKEEKLERQQDISSGFFPMPLGKGIETDENINFFE